MPKKIDYPYLPYGKEFKYLPEDNHFMKLAKEYALQLKGNLQQPSAMLIVRDGKIISKGSIGDGYHKEHGCERIKLNMPTGKGYELCPGCDPINHSESSAVTNAQKSGQNMKDADGYFWGHWWCCEGCWQRMIAAGIRDVYLLEGSEILFNRSAPGNILG